MRKRVKPVAATKAEMVAATIQKEILTGQLPYGGLLQSENELVQRFAVSRNTVRKGLEELTNNGFIARKGGVGSFVTYNGKLLDSTLGWSQALESADVGAQTKLLQLAIVEDPALARELNIDKHAFVAVDRLRSLSNDAKPISLECSRIPFSEALTDVPLKGLIGGSLNLTLVQYGMVPEHGEEWAEVIALDEGNAAILQRPVNTPFLRTRRLTRDKNGYPVEYVTSLLDPAHFALHLEF